MKEQISHALKIAMKAREKATVSVLRSLQAAIKQIEIDKQCELDDAGVMQVLQKQIKQRQESFKIYTDNDRADLAAKEQSELEVLAAFMPEQLSDDVLLELVNSEIAAQGASSMKDMGKIMDALKTKVAGKADPANISKLIKQQLG